MGVQMVNFHLNSEKSELKLKSCKARTCSEDAASSLEIDSVCSVVRVSVHRSTRTNSGSNAESDTERSPRRRPSKQAFPPASLQAWDKIERKKTRAAITEGLKLAFSPNVCTRWTLNRKVKNRPRSQLQQYARRNLMPSRHVHGRKGESIPPNQVNKGCRRGTSSSTGREGFISLQLQRLDEELLEIYKMEIQDTLGKTKEMGNIDSFLKPLQENVGDCPRGFNSLYNSPLYAGKFFDKSPTFIEKNGGRPACQGVCTCPTRPDFSKDSEIKKLKMEVAQLRVELQQRDSKRPDSPKLKLSPGSLPSPRLPTSRPLVADTDWSGHFLSRFEPQNMVGISPLPEVIPEQMEPEHADSFEETKTITIPARQNGSKQYPNGEVDRFDRSDIFSSRTIELDVDDRGWVPIPDECRDDIAAPMPMENGIGQMERMYYQERNAPQEDIHLSVDLNSDEDDLPALKTAVHKLSRLFCEQEEKLEIFKHLHKKGEANDSQAEDVKNLYLDMLKELSQQLGELCRDLHAKTQSVEVLLKQERTIQKCHPLQRLAKKFQYMEKMEKPAATTKDLEIAQQREIEYEDTSIFSTNKLKCGAKQSIKGEEDQPEIIMADSENVITALQAAEKKIEEQISTNLSLTQKLESGSHALSKTQAEHARGAARKDLSINYANQLNFDLSKDMSQTETRLAEIISRYKSLVSTLERQLDDVKKEALSLQDAVNTLKEEILRKGKSVSSLEAEAKEHKLQIELLRSQIADTQNDTSENGRGKLELLNSLEAMRREVDEQQNRVTELISINEDLIAFSESKEDEITGLKLTIKGLQQCVEETSGEAAKLIAESLVFSQEVVEKGKEGEIYRLRCIALKSKLEEIEHELQAREASMERLTQHLGKTTEGRDFTLEEKEKLLLSLNGAQYKEHRLDDQVRQSKVIIQDLEEILSSMDAEINGAMLEMAEMKTKSLED